MNRSLERKAVWLIVILIFVSFLAPAYFLFKDSDSGKKGFIKELKTGMETEIKNENKTQQSKVIALTFDDGPKPKVLDELLPLLGRYNIKATFFVNGYRFEKNKTAASYITALSFRGHSIQNHTFYHENLKIADVKYGRQWILDDIDKNSDLIEKYAGVRPIFFRPPYEIVGKNLRNDIENKGFVVLSLKIDVDSVDYRLALKNETRKNIVKNLEKAIQRREINGKFCHILLFHELRGTVKALPDIIKSFSDMGYEFDTIENVYPQCI